VSYLDRAEADGLKGDWPQAEGELDSRERLLKVVALTGVVSPVVHRLPWQQGMSLLPEEISFPQIWTITISQISSASSKGLVHCAP